jgi:hypothetical protein
MIHPSLAGTQPYYDNQNTTPNSRDSSSDRTSRGLYRPHHPQPQRPKRYLHHNLRLHTIHSPSLSGRNLVLHPFDPTHRADLSSTQLLVVARLLCGTHLRSNRIHRALFKRKEDPYNLIFFVLDYFFIVTAPVFLAAGIYTILSILIRETTSGNRFSVVSPRLILGFFIASDVVSTVIQISGAVLVGIRESRRQDPAVANHILLGGLAYQVFAMSIFIVLSMTFVLRARHALKSEGLSTFAAVFVLSTLMVYLRTVFRLAETAEGLFGKLATHEVFFGCLEFAPIALVALLLEVWHPGRCIGLRRERAFRGREKAGA